MLAISERIDVDRQEVLRHIGYGANGTPSAQIECLINEYRENANQLIEPLYSYVIKDIDWVQGNISFVADQIIFKSRVIAGLLRHCNKVAIFVATIGNRLEEMVCHLAEEKLVLQATVLDAIGSVMAETVVNSVQHKIGEIASAEGLCMSQRFSPGYCDWNIGQQRMLFQALRGNTAGVRLTKRCLMIPQKSISGIIGIGPGDGNVENYNPCNTCKKQDCPGRR